MKLNKTHAFENDFWQSTMSDIAFLLIIFFILTAVFSVSYVLRFSNNQGSVQIIEKKELITVEIKKNGSLFMDNQRIPENKFIKFLQEGKKYRILVDDSRPFQEFIDLLGFFNEAGIKDIEIATE